MSAISTSATSSPKLIPVWPDWGKAQGLKRGAAYYTANKLPKGVRVKIGGMLRLNLDLLNQYLAAGGDLAWKAG